MRTYFLLLLAILSFRPLPLYAQNQAKSISEMNWDELIEVGDSLLSTGNNAGSIPFLRAALERARQDSSEMSLAYGGSLDYLGYALHHLGNFAEAETVLSAGVEHARRYLGESHEDYMTRLSNLAMLHRDMGKYPKAISELEIAVRLGKKNLAGDNAYLPIMVNNLGLLFEASGDLDRALEHYLAALKLTEQTVGKANARYAIRLNNIASIYRRLGKTEQSQVFALEAFSIFEKTVGKTHPLYAVGLNSITINYGVMGMKKEEMLRAEELRLLVESPSIRETPEAYDYVSAIGGQYLHNAQWERCAEYCRTELLRFRELYPKQYSKQNYLTSILTLALEQNSKINEAAEYALMQNSAILQDLRENYNQFSEKEQSQFYNTSSPVYVTPYLFSMRHPEFTQLAGGGYNYQMTVKGMSMANRRQLFQSLREHPEAGLAAQFEEWQQLQNDISKQYALTPVKRQGNLDSLIGRSNELERNLAIGSDVFRFASKEANWQDVQAALAPGEAAIEFGQLKNWRNDTTCYVAWLIRPGYDTPRQVYLFEEREIGPPTAIRRLYAPETPSSGKNLQTLVWNALEPLLNGVSTLYYAPAGILHQINLGAIPVSPSETMADRFLLHRLISTRQIISLKSTPEFAVPVSALVFGGIRYDSDSLALASTNRVFEGDTDFLAGGKRGFSNGADWDYLAGSLQEAVSVHKRLNAVNARVVFADGFQASEAYFKQSVQSSAPSLLHLATHGFFIAATDSSARTGFASAGNPMARAGLALSGANRVWSGKPAFEGQEDGILTALEISRMDLSGTELAVLSACGTGQGKIEAGEGVLGLQRAFKMAGVHYVIMTLWNVQDEDAQQFMDLFYGEWLTQKKTVPDAFRAAQQRMRALHTQPFQPTAWAGFLLLE
ncbi:MAG TPA: CHAT domain-containing protein [Saprospiraceae bacterium]|nr:CHAT domain-containing protein [Saprospiraceae bacterium]HPI05956.1 CHAT domain-containing protein [Saprospiraceae bacterium]